ncbi:MAG: hypothetical protein ACI4WH_06245 [Oscillospiraceae bacterium]
MIVLLIVLILLAVIIYLPVCLSVRYIDGELSYKVTYAFITFYPKKKKKKVKVKKDNKSSDKKSRVKSQEVSKEVKSNDGISEEKSTIEGTKTDSEEPLKDESNHKEDINPDMKFMDTINLVLDMFNAIKKKLGKFIKSFRITNLYINFKLADQDAYDCALKFGKMNILVYNVLGYLERNFKVKKKSINLEPKYNSNNSIYDISFKVKIGFGNGLGKILVMIFKVIPILKDNDII